MCDFAFSIAISKNTVYYVDFMLTDKFKNDYQLKVRSLLRNSEFRDIITELSKGEFVFIELDQKLRTELFI